MDKENIEWSVSDWCFYDFGLYQVEKVAKDGRVTRVAGEMWSCGGFDFRSTMFPLSLAGLRICKEFENQHTRLHKEAGRTNINFPDIRIWMVSHWCDCMRAQDNKKVLAEKLRQLSRFVNEILHNLSPDKTVEGVRLFR